MFTCCLETTHTAALITSFISWLFSTQISCRGIRKYFLGAKSRCRASGSIAKASKSGSADGWPCFGRRRSRRTRSIIATKQCGTLTRGYPRSSSFTLRAISTRRTRTETRSRRSRASVRTETR